MALMKSFVSKKLHIAVAITLLVSLLATNCRAQVTFSRDWNAGKRAVDNQDLHAVKSAAALCHLLMNQIHQLANCEARMDELESASAPIYSGGR